MPPQKNLVHGTVYGYHIHHCKCFECRNAWRVYNAQLRVQRAQRLANDPSLAPHGTRSTYVNWSCRCEDCTHANRNR